VSKTSLQAITINLTGYYQKNVKYICKTFLPFPTPQKIEFNIRNSLETEEKEGRCIVFSAPSLPKKKKKNALCVTHHRLSSSAECHFNNITRWTGDRR
jgi:hypothetical protein